MIHDKIRVIFVGIEVISWNYNKESTIALSNGGYDSGHANQTTCKGYASYINKGNGYKNLQ